VKVPNINHLLHHCCVHFAWAHGIMGHGWRAFSDVQAFVASEQIDWDAFTALANRSGTDTCCYWTLRLSANLAGVRLPPGVLRDLRPHGPDFVLDRLERHFTLNLMPGEELCPSRALRERLWRMGIQRGKGSAGITLPDKPRPPGVFERVPDQFRRLRAWSRYMGRLA
jgi:Uncharacterised nucleotidyltransferase